MCEFNVILNGTIQARDVIYAKQEGANVVVRDVMGTSQTYQNCKIQEVDVANARLVLIPA